VAKQSYFSWGEAVRLKGGVINPINGLSILKNAIVALLVNEKGSRQAS
jgi:hypothetical protein